MKKRNEGIDLLRCVAMLMIPVLHVLNHGGILGAAAVGSTSYHGAWLLEIAAYSAVNCYALISGYIGVKVEFRYRRILPLWLQVMYYSLLIALLQPLLMPGAEKLPLVAALLPVTHRHYWYFTCYFGLFFLMPLINKAVRAMSRTEAKRLLAGILAVFCGMSMLPFFNLFKAVRTEDIFSLDDGCSVMWLALMYVVGACVREHGFGRKLRRRTLLAGYGLAVLASWLFKLFVEEDASEALRPLLDANALLYYPSITTVTAAVCLLLLFSRMQELPPLLGKIVDFVTPSTFAVYLIHEHRSVRAGLIAKRFEFFAAEGPLALIGKVLLVAVMIFAFSVLIDLARRYLFRLLRVNRGVDWLADRFSGEDDPAEEAPSPED